MHAPALRALAGVLAFAACGGDDNATPDAGGDARTPDAREIDADPGTVPRVETTSCRFEVPSSLGLTEGPDYACGDLVVFENRSARGRTIRVHYIKFESASASPNATIYLSGGPGGDAQTIISYAAALAPTFFDGLRADGDFLVLAQRGTARSIPFLDCQSFDCSDFASDYDLASYNTAENADDVEELRAALGYPKLNLYGISYGSRLALEVMRRHGGSLRSSVVEGLVPSSVPWPAAVPSSFYSALTALHASCTAAGACGTAFGNLVTKFSAGVAALDADPVSIMVAGQPFDLDGGTYAFVLFRMMYSRSSYVVLPMMISDLAERRVDRVGSYIGNALVSLGNSSVSAGLYNGVVCSEILNPPDENVFDQLNAGVPQDIIDLYGGNWFGLIERCREWPKRDHQAQLAQPVSSAVRTLVSSGRLDPITPPAYGDIAAATLSNAVEVTHENSGHGATLQSACGTQNLVDFIGDPITPHDTSCAAAIANAYMIPGMFAPPAISAAQLRAELSLAPPLPPSILARLPR